MRFSPFIMMSLLFQSSHSLPVRYMAIRGIVRNKTSASDSRRFASSSTNVLEKKPKVIFVLGGMYKSIFNGICILCP